jgi:hypothetical protein
MLASEGICRVIESIDVGFVPWMLFFRLGPEALRLLDAWCFMAMPILPEPFAGLFF